MRSLLTSAMYVLLLMWMLLSLLPLEVQARALSQQNLGPPHRFSLLRTLKIPKSSFIVIGPAAPDPPEVTYHHIARGDGRVIWMAWLRGEPLLGSSDLLLGQTDRVLRDTPVWRSRSRGRRHANNGGGRGHGQLMRVACVLGTCQVQNLSHRLYQLIGQSGKEDSSPMNPHSPHSYG